MLPAVPPIERVALFEVKSSLFVLVVEIVGLEPENVKAVDVKVFVFMVLSTVNAPAAWTFPFVSTETPVDTYPPPTERVSNTAAPAPDMFHWASCNTKSEPVAAPIVIIPPAEFPIVVFAAPVTLS